MQKQNEKLIFLNITDSEKSDLTAEDIQQNKADVEQQGSPEQSREASSVANTSDDQEKEDREKRKETKVGGTCFNHTHHRANFSVPEPTIDVSVARLLVVRVSQQFPTISRYSRYEANGILLQQ